MQLKKKKKKIVWLLFLSVVVCSFSACPQLMHNLTKIFFCNGVRPYIIRAFTKRRRQQRRYNLLNDEIESCCTCGTPFGAIFGRSLPDDLIFEVLTTTQARPSQFFILCLLHKNHLYQSRERTIHLVYTHDQHGIIAKQLPKFYFNVAFSL